MDHAGLEKQLASLFVEKLTLEVPAGDSDLIEAGILDSLKFVELLFHIEQTFGVRLSMDAFEIDDFRSIAKIAEFLANQNSGGKSAPD